MIRRVARLNNVDLSKIQLIQMDASARTMQFLTRKIDVMSVYLSNELPQIEKRAGVKFNVIKVTDFALRVRGSSMYVSSAFAEQNPETVKKLLRATAKGYRDAMANPKEAAKIMAKHMVVAEQPGVLDAQVEATVVSTNAPAGKPIGALVETTDRKSTRLNSSHTVRSYAVFCLKKKIIHRSTGRARNRGRATHRSRPRSTR